MDINKAKKLLIKAKHFNGIMLSKHDTDSERLIAKQKMKKLIDAISSGKEFVICLFEVWGMESVFWYGYSRVIHWNLNLSFSKID